VTYQALYQVGVFISRSSVYYFPIQRIWIPSVLQVATLGLALSQALYAWIPNIWLVFLMILWEGLLGGELHRLVLSVCTFNTHLGATYVNCYYQLTKRVHPEHREFALGTVGMADGFGITLAGVQSLFIEGALCQWQVDHGRSLCRMT
jgi:battenin